MSHSHQKPKKYSENNSLQFQFAMSVLEKIKIGPSSHILDIGCRDGLISSKLAELVPSGHVIGSDLSEDMALFASDKYAGIPNLSFQCVDATKLTHTNQFDVVTSFNALHWVKDQASALRCITTAAKENATILLLLSHKKSLYHFTLESVCAGDRWKSHFIDYVNPRSFFEKNAYSELLVRAGLNIISLDEVEMTHHFANRDKLKDFYRASMANVKQILLPDKEKFLDDVCQTYLAALNADGTKTIPLVFWCLVVNASKNSLATRNK